MVLGFPGFGVWNEIFCLGGERQIRKVDGAWVGEGVRRVGGEKGSN